ncbi:uncharacterized protein RAG0_06023 [Rhynchosporium agropyri]|uniref:Zn(2)-C6 fungal-type domain-containing protein n=1 Tax=Rhynchosporium agropyri TaxID=914238 RepID=A0A1E1KFR4_9HELO|nr:uncharacterized protein RAG0_06023 [Rhynchosporium agropyri]
MADNAASSSHPSRKRRKIALACEHCRDRKIRCDGQMPACGACQRRSNTRNQPGCIYINESSTKSLQEQRYVQALQERLRLFEARETQRNASSLQHSYHDSGDLRQLDIQQTHDNYIQPPATNSPARDISADPSRGLHLPSTGKRQDVAYNNTYEAQTTTSPAEYSRDRSRNDIASSAGFAGWEKRGNGNEHLSSRTGHVHQTSLLATAAAPGDESDAFSPSEKIRGGEQSTSIPVSQESPVSAMGAAASTSAQGESNQDNFYGTSSAISLFHQVQSHINQNGSNSATDQAWKSNQRRKSGACYSQQNLEHDSDISAENLSLPPRALADQLLKQYWQRVHCLFPIIHRKSFEARYRQLWEAENHMPREGPWLNVGLGSSFCPTSIFHSALNAMFALGCNFSDLSSAKRSNLTQTFSKRSLDILSSRFLDSGSLALVQALLIVAQYLQSTDLPTRCWNVVGLAIRMAQGLGLYVDPSSTRSSHLENEMRRRTWHGCLMLDVLTGMTLGRPITVSRVNEYPLPLAVDDEFLEAQNSTAAPGTTFSVNEFFVQVLKLYIIMGEILEQVYGPWDHAHVNGQNGRDRLKISVTHKIIDLECVLSDYELSIPKKLHWDQGGLEVGDPDELMRQRNVLHTRFLHLKLLLYRPVFHHLIIRPNGLQQEDTSERSQNLSKSANGGPLSSSLDILTQRYASTCVETAQELIALIGRTMDSHVGGSWWYAMFYVFSSAMVLLLAEIRLPMEDSRTESALKSSWQECLNILHALSPKYNGAARCAKTLIRMREQAVAKQSRNASHHDLGSLNSTWPVPRDFQQSGQVPPVGLDRFPYPTVADDGTGAHYGDVEIPEYLWDKSGYLMQWDLNGQDWWGGLLDQT